MSKYCEVGEIKIIEDFEYMIDDDDKMLEVEVGSHNYNKYRGRLDINYCPFCGREL